MSLLIDGYNLLHASGVLPRASGPATLERARIALLDYLASELDPQEIRQTTVVFDAKNPPQGVPDVYGYLGMTIRFARDYADADMLLIELIRFDSAPRQLLVVSSDHQVQRAAKRRRARTIDSDRWCAELARRGRRFELPTAAVETKPPAPLPSSEVQRWLREFGDVATPTELDPPRRTRRRFVRRQESNVEIAASGRDSVSPAAAENSPGAAAADSPAAESSSIHDGDSLIDEAKRLAASDRSLANPFPPGYAEDLLADEEG